MEEFEHAVGTARAAEILEQIESLNNIIEQLRQMDGLSMHIEQYEYLRSRFIEELRQILAEYGLTLTADQPAPVAA
jgi:hypothetical protein